MDTVFEFLLNQTGKNVILTGCILYIIMLLAGYEALNKSWQLREYFRIPRWRNSIAAAAAVPFFLIVGIGMIPKTYWQADAVLLILGAGTIGALIWNLLKRPSKEKLHMDKLYKDNKNPIETYRQFLEINVSNLTPKEQLTWKRRKYFLLYQLGAMGKAMELVKETEKMGSAQAVFFEAIEAELAGNMETSERKMKLALDKTADTKQEHFLREQILNNYGRCCRIRGNAREADAYYRRAVEELRLPEEKSLVEVLYTNFIFNLCVLRETPQIVSEWMEKYRNLLDMNCIEDQIKYSNFELEVARQQENEEKCCKLIEESFCNTMKLVSAESERLVYEATSLRMAHTAGANYIPCLVEIRKDLQDFGKLKMPERYLMIKEIHILFRPETRIAPEVHAEYADVEEFADSYIRYQAKKDLTEYAKKLPVEAVYEYCRIQTELAGIERYQEVYSYEDCEERLQSVRDTYEHNGLLMDALRCSLHMADENFYLKNMDRTLMPKYRERLQEALIYAEKIVQGVKLHPGCAECFVQLAFYYLRLHQYEKCSSYMERFEKCKLAQEHYTPWMREMLQIAAFMSKVQDIQKRLMAWKTDKAKQIELSPAAREWLQRYPNTDSMETTLLWGGLLGYETVFAKRKIWLNETGAVEHCWLCIQAFLEHQITVTVLELDMTYGQLEEADEGQMLFVPGMHPLESGSSIVLREDQEKTGMIVLDVQRGTFTFPERDAEGKMTVLGEICRKIRTRVR